MKYLFIFLSLLVTEAYAFQTPQQIMSSEGFVLVTKDAGRDIYYRPKEVKSGDGFVYYSTTTFFKSGSNKYGLRSEYMSIACKEKKAIKLGLHVVPYIGKSSYTDYTKKGIKESDFKSLTALDKIMSNKLCK